MYRLVSAQVPLYLLSYPDSLILFGLGTILSAWRRCCFVCTFALL